MPQDEVEIYLESSRPDLDYSCEVTLNITAFLQDTGYYDRNTLTFQCNPMGSNYTGSFLKATLEDQSQLIEIRNFLEECFEETDINRRTLTLEIQEGVVSITPYQNSVVEEEIDQITIEVHDNRIEFFQSGRLHPYIFSYEEKIDDNPQDNNNAEKLLKFLDKIISIHPDLESNTLTESIALGSNTDHQYVEQLLDDSNQVPPTVGEKYAKAVAEFKGEAFGDAIRDLGIAAECLISLFCEDLYTEDSIPSDMGGQIDKLTNRESGQTAFIGKTIAPVWSLRNQFSHPTADDPSNQEALFAFHCFHIAVETLITDYFEA